MLAEIFFLRLEAKARVLQDTIPTSSSTIVPFGRAGAQVDQVRKHYTLVEIMGCGGDRNSSRYENTPVSWSEARAPMRHTNPTRRQERTATTELSAGSHPLQLSSVPHCSTHPRFAALWLYAQHKRAPQQYLANPRHEDHPQFFCPTIGLWRKI